MQKGTNNQFYKKLGKRIRDFRKERGMTQLDLAVAYGNYAEQVGRVERGELNVTIGTLRDIAKALDVPLSHLVDVE